MESNRRNQQRLDPVTRPKQSPTQLEKRHGKAQKRQIAKRMPGGGTGGQSERAWLGRSLAIRRSMRPMMREDPQRPIAEVWPGRSGGARPKEGVAD